MSLQTDHPDGCHTLCCIALFAPRTQTSRRFAFGATAVGAEIVAPPRELQPDQPPPSLVRRQIWPSVPLTKRSSLFVPREATAGADVVPPPMLVHPLHEVVQVLRQMPASPPRTKTSIFPFAFEMAAGAEVAPPGGDPSED